MARAELRDLLKTLFDQGGMRRFIGDTFGNELLTAVNWDKELDEVAERVVQRLEERGLISDDLFAALVDKRPMRKPDIDVVRDAFAPRSIAEPDRPSSSSADVSAGSADNVGARAPGTDGTSARTPASGPTYDVLISHASEDKHNVVEPLVAALKEANISVWYDADEIEWGDSITEKINHGLTNSRFIVVVLSNAFLEKQWPRSELSAALSREIHDGGKTVLPLIVCETGAEDDLLKRIPLLKDRHFLPWENNATAIAAHLRKAVSPPKPPTGAVGAGGGKTDPKTSRFISSTQAIMGVLAVLVVAAVVVGWRSCVSSKNKPEGAATPPPPSAQAPTLPPPPPTGMAYCAPYSGLPECVEPPGCRFKGEATNNRAVCNQHECIDARRAPKGMVSVPAGWFPIGCRPSDERCDPVDAFFIDKYEVTAKAYAECVAKDGCKPPKKSGMSCNWEERSNRAEHPINCVDWHEAKRFCELQHKKLPTQAQWEWAARGADAHLYPWGNNPAPSCDRVNMEDSKGNGCGTHQTEKVGQKTLGVSPYGALHMVGNVMEWTADLDGRGNAHTRGGSWGTPANKFLSAWHMDTVSVDGASEFTGFRCAQTASEATIAQPDQREAARTPERRHCHLKKEGYANITAANCKNASRAGVYPATQPGLPSWARQRCNSVTLYTCSEE